MSFRFKYKSIPQFLMLSVVAHLFFVLLAARFNIVTTNNDLDFNKKNKTTINFEILDEKKVNKNIKSKLNEKMRIVDQNKINNTLDPNSKLLSSHNQKVNDETVAKNHGSFQNIKSKTSSKLQSKNQENKPRSKATRSPVPLPPDVFGTYKSSLAKALEKQKELDKTESESGADVSRSRDYLPDKKDGLETLLSTREFVYYSYYTRIRNQLSEYWEPKIKQKVMTMFKQGRRIASADDHITKLQIILNSKGLLVKVQVLGASGIQDLDEVAVDAFRAAAPFPNPPKGIIEDDGTVKIEWDFVVET